MKEHQTLPNKQDAPLAVACRDLLAADNQQPKSWRCFHCDEVFTDRVAAEGHFGASVVCAPICQIYGTTVRNMENELRRYREEDTDLHRKIAHMQTEHIKALMRAEESGYAKGLKDGRELAANDESSHREL